MKTIYKKILWVIIGMLEKKWTMKQAIKKRTVFIVRWNA